MSDKEKLLQLFDEWGIKPKIEVNEEHYEASHYEFDYEKDDTILTISEDDENETVKGYSDFYTRFIFDKEGKYKWMGLYE